LDLYIEGLCLSSNKLPTREVIVESCCFWRYTCFDLPSCNQMGMHHDNKIAFKVEEMSMVSFASQRG